MFIAILTWLALDETHWSLILKQMDTSTEFKRLRDGNNELVKTNRDLNDQVLMLQRTAGIDKQTMSQMQEEIRELQDQVYHLKGELEFYQGILDSTREVKGLNIQGIHVEALAKAQNYRLKVVLTHMTKNVKVAEGTIRITLEGVLDGTAKKLDLREVALDDSLDLSFRFRNFKRFESDLELPDGFDPQRVFIQLQPKDSGRLIINRIFDWPQTAG